MESETSKRIPEWTKIPKKMQQQFFEFAQKEARETKTRLLKDRAKLVEIGKLFRFRDVPLNEEWKNWRVCVVDGTDSPVMSERVGGRFGAYGVTYHIFEGMKLVEEDYYSGQVVDLQVGDSEASEKMLSLLTTALERDIALSCLEKNIDLLLIDGSFFGFRPRCRIIHNRRVPSEEYEGGAQLVKHVRNVTTRLLESGKVIGIIKRVQTSALDGWSIFTNGDERSVMNRNDREILSSLMKERQYFSYESLFKSPVIFNYFTRLALAYHRYARDKSRGIESIFKACRNEVDRNVRRDLFCRPEQIFRTSRHYVRCSYPASTLCFETPIKCDLENLLAFFQATCNKATGLPLHLDLTDQDIAMPRGFTQELVEEIEANLVKDPDLDKFEVENHFASLNPQKNE
jgi:hypothetical protein